MGFGYWHSLSRLPVSDRIGFVHLEYGSLEKDGHALVFRQKDFTQAVPVGQVACIMLGPGTSSTRDAIALCADRGCLVLWVGSGGVRLYAAGLPGSAAPEALLRQAAIVSDPAARLHAARRLFSYMFQKEAPLTRSVEQLRGMEGARVKAAYAKLSEQYHVSWGGRAYGEGNARAGDIVNQALSCAHQALYGMAEAAILALGYSPALGIVHNGDRRSFVFDVADVVKFETSAPLAFEIAAEGGHQIDSRIRAKFRERAHEFKLLPRLVSVVQMVFAEQAG